MKVNKTVIGTTCVGGAIALGFFFASLPGISVAKGAGKSGLVKHPTDQGIAPSSLVKTVGKPTLDERARDAAIERDRQEHYVNPILLAIKNGNVKEVKSIWRAYNVAGFVEDSLLRLQLAKFFVRQGDKREAHGQLEAILHPPKGSWSSLQRSGEVMSLYLETSTPSDRSQANVAIREWDSRVSSPNGPMADSQDLPVEAKVEWLRAQELEAQAKPSEALESYRKVAQLATKSFFAQKQLGLALKRAGDAPAAKQAMIRAYKLAPTNQRSWIKRLGRITDNDLRKANP